MTLCPVALRLSLATALLALGTPPERRSDGTSSLHAAPSGTAAAHDSTRASGRDAASLRQRDYVVERWADRNGRPIRVWIATPNGRVTAWNAAFPAAVRSAFGEWEDRRLPVRFTFVKDSAAAEVRVRWVSRFNTDESGR